MATANKLRTVTSGFVRISKKAIKIAKSHKKRTGVPIGTFIEQAIFEKDAARKESKSIDHAESN